MYNPHPNLRPARVAVCVYLPRELHDRLREYCSKFHVPQSDIGRQAIEMFFEDPNPDDLQAAPSPVPFPPPSPYRVTRVVLVYPPPDIPPSAPLTP